MNSVVLVDLLFLLGVWSLMEEETEENSSFIRKIIIIIIMNFILKIETGFFSYIYIIRQMNGMD